MTVPPFPGRGPRSQAMSDEITKSLDLVLRAQGGDKEALNRLLERYYPRVLRVVRMRLGSRLRECLESGDIRQEAFMAAVGALDNFEMREEASLVNWLSKLVERQIIAAADRFGAKKRDRRRNVSLTSSIADTEGPGGAGTLPDAKSPGPLDAIADGEEQRIVEECVAQLPERYRELIILRNYTGASWEAVAEETGHPSAAAARMMHARALVELGKLIRAAGGG